MIPHDFYGNGVGGVVCRVFEPLVYGPDLDEISFMWVRAGRLGVRIPQGKDVFSYPKRLD
jgi:hypothetical protein